MLFKPSIKTVYSFIASTILLDLNSPMGKAMVQQIHPYACQNLQKNNREFKKLYRQVEKENTPHVLGTGMAASVDGFAEAFSTWLKSQGVNITDADRKGKTFVFGGDAQHPQTGLTFKWSVLIYFDLGG